jgi:hypothetical protein
MPCVARSLAHLSNLASICRSDAPKTTANGTTKYLVDELNPTGYAQVLDEVQSGNVVRTYNYGLELISEQFPASSPLSTIRTPIFYVFDGHGSVRALGIRGEFGDRRNVSSCFVREKYRRTSRLSPFFVLSSPFFNWAAA